MADTRPGNPFPRPAPTRQPTGAYYVAPPERRGNRYLVPLLVGGAIVLAGALALGWRTSEPVVVAVAPPPIAPPTARAAPPPPPPPAPPVYASEPAEADFEPEPPPAEPAPYVLPAPQLRLLNWRWSARDGRATVIGEVQSLASTPLDKIEAEVRWYAADGSLVAVKANFIDRRPLRPGEVSPFTISEKQVASMASVKVAFRAFLGASIPTEGEGAPGSPPAGVAGHAAPAPRLATTPTPAPPPRSTGRTNDRALVYTPYILGDGDKLRVEGEIYNPQSYDIWGEVVFHLIRNYGGQVLQTRRLPLEIPAHETSGYNELFTNWASDCRVEVAWEGGGRQD